MVKEEKDWVIVEVRTNWADRTMGSRDVVEPTLAPAERFVRTGNISVVIQRRTPISEVTVPRINDAAPKPRGRFLAALMSQLSRPYGPPRLFESLSFMGRADEFILLTATVPMPLDFGSGIVPASRRMWCFSAKLFSADETLTAEEVRALIAQKETSKRRKVERALAATKLPENPMAKRQPIPEDVKVFVWRRDRARCVKCGAAANLEYDHIIPLAMGGSNTARNLQVLCADCNRSKGAHLE